VDVNGVFHVSPVVLLPGNGRSVPVGRRRVGPESISVPKGSYHQRKLKINLRLIPSNVVAVCLEV
jgi:hypothetical protein